MHAGSGIVTGGGSGIGEAVVERLLREGAQVIAADRDAPALARLSARLACDRLVTVPLDVSDEAAVLALTETCIARFGALNYLVNCAGIAIPAQSFESTSVEDFERTHAINLRGTFLTMRSAIRHMMSHGGGAIVNIASTAGIRPLPEVTSYTASKFGVVGISLTAALETASSGIRINVVCPGVTDTPLYRAFSKALGEAANKVAQATPMRRPGQPAEIANAVQWLLSSEASYVTGLVMPVDGGLALI